MILTKLIRGFVFASVVFSFHQSAVADAQSEVDAAMTSSPSVAVFQKRNFVGVSLFFGFEPIAPISNRGVIVYPGAFQDPRAYAPIARHFADQGYYAAVVTPPFNFGFLGTHYGTYVKNHWRDDVADWVVAGHSLGGTVAALWVDSNRAPSDGIAGLVLLAAYPDALTNLSDIQIPVTSIWGSVDGLTTESDIEGSKNQLPASTNYVRIEGGNHTQFYYSDTLQNNDNPAQISREAQQLIVEREIAAMLN
ncbi:alpha/beta hydrolase [Microbulbifer agarilyticus]|uniref:alpha/beta hydrolase n=1 Tax=Microbulbifer agarilyticus TaxID=260552 RepID=UPI001C96A92F|nr:alpha/beta hydrolase [Microbulbifer agarilyticus]MBY6190620.1 alpha/beta hydrolase [Microbulbifer agarilyticus]